MREAAVPALPAVRSIAQIWWREVMVFDSSLVSPANLADSGKARVNRRTLLAERDGANQARQVMRSQ